MRTPAGILCLILSLTAVAIGADSLNVRLVGGCDTPGDASGVCVSGDYAYVADKHTGLRVISIADPANPVEVGYYDTPGEARDVAVSGDYAYVADAYNGLRVISIADPANPVEVGSLALPPGEAQRVTVVGDLLYVADGTGGLRVVSIALPDNPVEVGRCGSLGWVSDVAVSGSLAYAVSNDLSIISVADPANPVKIGSLEDAGALGVAVNGYYAYTAVGSYGLEIFRVSDPGRMIWVGLLRTLALGVAESGGFAYVVTEKSGLLVVSVADPAHPYEVGHYHIYPQYCNDVTLRGDTIYVAFGPIGLQIFQYYGAGVEETPSVEVRTTSPGPTVLRGNLHLPLASGVERRASSVLMDATGRKVLNLKPGENDISHLAPGVYFVREELPASSHKPAVRKVVLTK